MQSNPSHITIVFIADIVGKPGLTATANAMNRIIDTYNPDLIIANGENSASGKGLTEKIAHQIFELGINIITSGNHIWNKSKVFPLLDTNPFILRPLNYPPNVPGHGSCIYEFDSENKLAILNLQGRTFMQSIDCPFRSIDKEIKKLKKKGVKSIFVDFHAEATAEKIAMGWYLDGRVSAVIGTHTHVQTADEKILPKGTAYITDVGMTGSTDSVIGMDKEIALNRFIRQIPFYYKIAANENNLEFCGVAISINLDTSFANSIERFIL
ncbi:MAG: TIGR00282 family metallophosphoesterase [bacterium]